MPLFRCIYFLGRRWWALCLFLDVFIFFGEGVGFMPLFRCIYLFLYIFFLKVYLFFHLFFFFAFWGALGLALNSSF